jgi:hypothetical protein
MFAAASLLNCGAVITGSGSATQIVCSAARLQLSRGRQKGTRPVAGSAHTVSFVTLSRPCSVLDASSKQDRLLRRIAQHPGWFMRKQPCAGICSEGPHRSSSGAHYSSRIVQQAFDWKTPQ